MFTTGLTTSKVSFAIYVDRSQSQWVVRDANGEFWIITPSENAWESRQPFLITEETKLESIPGHYLGLFGLHA